MAWKVKKTESFDKWWKKEKVDDQNFKFHEKALKDFETVNVPHNVSAMIFQNSNYECWTTRLPDKVRKRGKRSAFRVVLILDIEEQTLFLQGIFRRDNLNYKGSAGKYQSQHDALLRDLAASFVKVI
jgi:hypothetical protein